MTKCEASLRTTLVLLCAALTIVHGFYPILSRGDSYSKKHYYRDNECSNYMEECTPWKTTCCAGMACVNLRKGFCLSPIEKCVCQKQRNQGFDSM